MRAPGLYPGVPEAEYHADDALSQSGAKLLLDAPARVIPDVPDTTYHQSPALSASGAKLILRSPAHYRYAMDHPPAPTAAFNLGHAVHAAILGGRDVAIIGADDYKTKAAREERDAYFEAGSIPLTRTEWAQVRAMADAVLSHPLAAALLSDGTPELSIFTTDPETGVALRSRPDWIGKDVIVDLKTTVNADPLEFGRMAHSFGYHSQARWYLDEAARAGLIGEDARFIFVLAEKTEPYLVSAVELDAEALRIGGERNRRAIDIFHHCTQTGTWPGYPTETAPIVSLPSYAVRQHEEEYL